MAQPIEKMIKNRIYGKKRGWCFTPNHFSDLGSNESIRKALSNLVKKEFIRRLAQGLYDYPEEHKTLGLLPPNIESVGKAIAEKYSIAIQPSGAYAANLLGLSEQVPAKVVFLTDGASKKITIGNLEITFKKTTPKNMKTAGTISGLVIQALKYIGQDNVTNEIINKLEMSLRSEDKKRLQLDKALAPIWIRKIIEEITENDK